MNHLSNGSVAPFDAMAVDKNWRIECAKEKGESPLPSPVLTRALGGAATTAIALPLELHVARKR